MVLNSFLTSFSFLVTIVVSSFFLVDKIKHVRCYKQLQHAQVNYCSKRKLQNVSIYILSYLYLKIPTLASKRATSERSRSLSLSSDFVLLASLVSLSLSNFISFCSWVLTCFSLFRLFSSSVILLSFLASDSSSSYPWHISKNK